MALYGATRFGLFCESLTCNSIAWDGGFLASAALIVPGLALAPYATAYRRAFDGRTVAVRPGLSFGRGGGTITIAGRF